MCPTPSLGSESIFLDDIPGNLKPAMELGITPIQVKNVSGAISELQDLMALDLGRYSKT